MFKIDLHIHTRLGGDSHIEPQDIIARAREVGLDAVCVTEDHSYDLSEPVGEISSAADFPIFRGMEYRADSGHLLVYGVRVTRGNLPSGMPMQKAVDWVQRNGGVAIPAHPYQHSLAGQFLGDDILQLKGLIALEVMNGSVSPEGNRRAEEAADKLGIHGIGGSDAHGLPVLGKAYTCFPTPVASMQELTAALKAGNYFPAWNRFYEVPKKDAL